MNFVAVTTSRKPPVAAVQQLALHHQRARRPLRRHAYRLSQVITYGFVPPQVFVN